MSRLIDADELKIDYGFTWDDITPTHDEMYALIDRQPTIEERMTGEWERKSFYDSTPVCSECGIEGRWDYEYCPYCGSYNGGEEHETCGCG